MRNSTSSGQALIVVLLVMSVALTIALSVVSRSITDISVSQKEESALRAISAAEAGAEKALIAGSGSNCATGVCFPNAQFSATITTLAEGVRDYVIPVNMSSGDVGSIWLVAHDSNSNLVCNSSSPCFTGDSLKVCWGNSGASGSSSTTPAMEISVLYSDGNISTAKIARVAADSNASRRSDNQFSAAGGSCSIDARNFAFSKEITLSSLGVTTRASAASFAGPMLVRLRLIYNTDQAHMAGLSANYPGNGVLPVQGKKIESLGESGEAKRKVVVYRPYSDIPPVFDFGIFSGSSALSK
ncbi:MAG: hypothetical protein A2782_01700 [Candidatus Blackburnbacteria bacterium RIFCSPHIGHO2_01_FULL_43_15b]|uniref:Type 4 fimbrial biogenesis protein PilX N-terminal domain-containing protein n=1 Tax=Candidatus Blackburnbacteria bacterium RIFCSPHIGHO2_01_FULL_43_15b TaxID=1797513 RepID=A0A1G1UXI9_9BACT|nr:MAG: hypothetical protein A2782_01700 [Candidatus Blackburnbacteria bacterium RIFCSPHIGHO2_01_FULL_43_15b]